MTDPVTIWGVSRESLTVVGLGLGTAIAGAVWARWSRWRLEQADHRPARPDTTGSLLTTVLPAFLADRVDPPLPRDLRAIERRLLWKLVLVVVLAQAVTGAVLFALLW